jgi:hypothetical protein
MPTGPARKVTRPWAGGEPRDCKALPIATTDCHLAWARLITGLLAGRHPGRDLSTESRVWFVGCHARLRSSQGDDKGRSALSSDDLWLRAPFLFGLGRMMVACDQVIVLAPHLEHLVRALFVVAHRLRGAQQP